jgi:type IV pilus assembly protein PilQ
VLVPNPDIRVDGVPVNGIGPINPVPPFQQRAVAPPVGDIAISSTDVSGFVLNLRTAERVPRLVLREAPVEDVLALLARAAGLNLAYVAEAAEDSAGGEASGRRTISLDVENESVQEVFNNVLRLSGLQANLMGNTVVVGTELPDEARNIITRTIRLNQTSILVARDFLLSHGAESALLSTQIQSQTLREGQPGELSSVSATTTTTRTRIEQLGLDRKDEPYTGYAALPLRGLLVSIAPRSVGVSEVANEISITGDPRKVEIASQLLTQLETRRRQAAINVKIVDISLSNQDTYNSSFAFQVGETFVTSDGGAGLVNFGGAQPPSREQIDLSPTTPPITTIPSTLVGSPNTVFINPNTGQVSPSFGSQGNTEILQPGITDIGNDGSITFSLPTLFAYPSRFLSQLEAQVLNGNAKILTDPILVVQEGQTSTISLTSQVVSRVNVSFTDTDAGTRETRDIELVDVGLTLPISLKRIDDNGFVTLETAPTVSSPVETVDLGNNQSATLVQRRAVNSGDIRLRDGQTLILSGIIQDTDRATVRKVPILGDIPLLGALFRSTTRENERLEVIILLTPNILDDSDYDTFGYGYTPSREARDILEQQGNFQYPGN